MTKVPKNIYDACEYPKTCAPDDFWGQVRRTVNGKPVPQEQIDVIFSTIRENIDFDSDDILLDIACGNGRLGFEFFNEISAYVGFDMSKYLIEVARNNFERKPNYIFLHESIQEYLDKEKNPNRFTKALWYGAFSYISQKEAINTLYLLRTRFSHLKSLFIGALPDRERANLFFQDREKLPLNDHTSSIGLWYTKSEVVRLAENCGWRTRISVFPETFFQAHYRFNIILTPME